jgi:hypothetical protein
VTISAEGVLATASGLCEPERCLQQDGSGVILGANVTVGINVDVGNGVRLLDLDYYRREAACGRM